MAVLTHLCLCAFTHQDPMVRDALMDPTVIKAVRPGIKTLCWPAPAGAVIWRSHPAPLILLGVGTDDSAQLPMVYAKLASCG